MVYKLEEPDPKTVDENQQSGKGLQQQDCTDGGIGAISYMFHTYVISLLAPRNDNPVANLTS